MKSRAAASAGHGIYAEGHARHINRDRINARALKMSRCAGSYVAWLSWPSGLPLPSVSVTPISMMIWSKRPLKTDDEGEEEIPEWRKMSYNNDKRDNIPLEEISRCGMC